MAKHRKIHGRHRAPSAAGQTAAKVAVAGAVAAMPAALVPAAHAGPPGGWGPVIACESGGNPRAENPTSTASGLFQFIDGTWRGYGGGQFAPRASGASADEQHVVAERAYAAEGLRPWNASKGCWGGKVGHGDAPAKPAKKATKAPAAPRIDESRAADGSGRYVCDTDTLRFEACDPHNLGDVVDYPLYQRRAAAAPPTGSYTVKPGDTLTSIAAAHGTTWRHLYDANRGVVEDPDRIYPGERLAL